MNPEGTIHAAIENSRDAANRWIHKLINGESACWHEIIYQQTEWGDCGCGGADYQEQK